MCDGERGNYYEVEVKSAYVSNRSAPSSCGGMEHHDRNLSTLCRHGRGGHGRWLTAAGSVDAARSLSLFFHLRPLALRRTQKKGPGKKCWPQACGRQLGDQKFFVKRSPNSLASLLSITST